MSKKLRDEGQAAMDALVKRDEDSSLNHYSLGSTPGWKELRENMRKEREKREREEANNKE